ncbi:MAG TPA: AAA family ATPase [Solirubrobacteraceae bacterium]|nr:AAA family ATPase [Solirubrobacteraceae bacterium]
MDRNLFAVGRPATLRGRASECAMLDALVDDLRRGESRSLVMRGEAGIGKTALLEYLVQTASGMTVARAAGVESEMELAYASLHQICGPLLDRLPGLPTPQRDALEIVFGVRAGAGPDRFLVGLGVLGLLSGVGEERPFLCIVDDAQWLDQASALTLAFVARRLRADPVGIVFAVREPGPELQHLPELEVRGVRDGEARALLSSAVGFKLDERVRDRIIAETRGNPLALLELPQGLTATQLAGGFGLPEARGLTTRIEESFLRRLDTLPEGARRLVLVAAAEPVGDPLLLWHAAQQLGIDRTAADAAVAQGLLAIDERVTFRHPLVRSAVYGSAAVEDRRAVHLALAEVTDHEVDPDRRAWHLAAAAAGPDEEIAAELERSAGRAQARGGAAAAAAFLKRSVALTRDPVRRAGRALAAAQAQLQAGAFDVALQLLSTAEAGSRDESGSAQVELLRGQIAFASTAGGEAPELLLHAARRIEALDIALARDTYLDAWGAALFASNLARIGDVREASRAAIAAPQPALAPRPSDVLLDGLAVAVTEGRAAAASNLRQATSAFAEGEIGIAEGLRWGWLATFAPLMLWDEESWHKLLVRQVQMVREAGLLVHLPNYLHSWGGNLAWRGEFSAAASLISEADVVAEATGTRFARYAAVVLAGLQGKEAEASAVIDVEVRNATAAGQGLLIQVCQWVSGTLYNGLGRYEKALEETQRANEAAAPVISAWALPELIEAAARTGKTQLGVEALEQLAEATGAGGTDWGLGVLARSRALLSDGDDAEGSYREAIDRLSRTALAPELARAHLVYGEWLRRGTRRVDARTQLRVAHDLFGSIGMEGFAERARTELQATGENVRLHVVETHHDLTAQEQQIAELARDGLSNPEIGARLFLSPRTVEWHLRHVFLKLGIKSRRELATAMPRSESEAAVA